MNRSIRAFAFLTVFPLSLGSIGPISTPKSVNFLRPELDKSGLEERFAGPRHRWYEPMRRSTFYYRSTTAFLQGTVVGFFLGAAYDQGNWPWEPSSIPLMMLVGGLGGVLTWDNALKLTQKKKMKFIQTAHNSLTVARKVYEGGRPYVSWQEWADPEYVQEQRAEALTLIQDPSVPLERIARFVMNISHHYEGLPEQWSGSVSDIRPPYESLIAILGIDLIERLENTFSHSLYNKPADQTGLEEPEITIEEFSGTFQKIVPLVRAFTRETTRYPHHPGVRESTEMELQNMKEMLENGLGTAYVARAGKQIAGYIFMTHHTLLDHDITFYVSLDHCYVRKAYRRQGIARKLMATALQSARRSHPSWIEAVDASGGISGTILSELGFESVDRDSYFLIENISAQFFAHWRYETNQWVIFSPDALTQVPGLSEVVEMLRETNLEDRLVVLTADNARQGDIIKNIFESGRSVMVYTGNLDADSVARDFCKRLRNRGIDFESHPVGDLQTTVRQILIDLSVPQQFVPQEWVKRFLAQIGLEEAA